MENHALLKSKKSTDWAVVICVTLFAVMMRLLPHVPNVTPISALALFSGAVIGRKSGIVLPLVAMVISDFFIGAHDTMFYVYGSFVLIGFLGRFLYHQRSMRNIIVFSLLSSFLFYFITNFGVWTTGDLYARNFLGLLQSYWYGLPFLRNTIIGDLLYSSLFFGAYEAVSRLLPRYVARIK